MRNAKTKCHPTVVTASHRYSDDHDDDGDANGVGVRGGELPSLVANE